MTILKWYDFAMIWARQRCGEIPRQELFRVKRQKEAFDMQLMELPYQRNKTRYRRKSHWKSTRKSTVKRSVIVIPRITKSKKSENIPAENICEKVLYKLGKHLSEYKWLLIFLIITTLLVFPKKNYLICERVSLSAFSSGFCQVKQSHESSINPKSIP